MRDFGKEACPGDACRALDATRKRLSDEHELDPLGNEGHTTRLGGVSSNRRILLHLPSVAHIIRRLIAGIVVSCGHGILVTHPGMLLLAVLLHIACARWSWIGSNCWVGRRRRRRCQERTGVVKGQIKGREGEKRRRGGELGGEEADDYKVETKGLRHPNSVSSALVWFEFFQTRSGRVVLKFARSIHFWPLYCWLQIHPLSSTGYPNC